MGPLGRNPPCAVYCGATRPAKSNAAPARMKATIVANLIMANQNSKRPKGLTLLKFTGSSRAGKRMPQIPPGRCGGEELMNAAEGTSSAPMENAIDAQYPARQRNPRY